jgi:DNA-binding response OmpR family regulator/drug/metabolite transporter (DMT)-like permease
MTEPAAILVVDDNSTSRTKLRMAVRAQGHNADAAEDGARALEALRETRYDAVLLDIVMPEVDGFDVLRAMQAEEGLRDIPVIVISSLGAETGSVVKAIELGAVDFLPKDFEPAILKARLDASLARKRFRDKELEYFRDVDKLTEAAQVIEAGAFRPAELGIAGVAERQDPIGRLAVVFHGLAQEIYDRERRLDRTARTLRGTLLVLVAGGIFGIAPALGRMSAGLGTPPLGLVFWANIVAVIVCFAIVAFRGGLPRLRLAHLRFFIPWALILGCFYQVFTVVISKHVEASIIALIGSSRGFMVFGLAALFALERPNLRRLAGLSLGFAAVAAVLLVRGTDGDESSGMWLIAALVLPLLLALHTLVMAWRPRDLDAFATVGIMMALSAMFLAPLAAASDSLFWPRLEFGRLELIILVLGAASAIAVALALDIVATAGAVFASQMAYSQTLAGIAWGMLLLDEQLSTVAWGALALVIIGFWLVEPKRADEEFKATVPLSRPPKSDKANPR